VLELIVTYLIVCFERLEVVAPSHFCLLFIYIYISCILLYLYSSL